MIDRSSNLVNVLNDNSWSLFQRLITVECPEKVGFATLDPCLMRLMDTFLKIE